MCKELLELMAPEVEQIRQQCRAEACAEARARTRAEDIRGVVQILDEMNVHPEEIKQRIMKQYELSDETADTYIAGIVRQ